MDERVTMSSLAKALGLSESTISRALKGDPRIGQATRERVEKLAEKLGYRRTGLVVPEFNNRISGYLWSGGALDWQTRQAESDRCVPFIPTAGNVEKEFTQWLKHEKPDSLLVYKFPLKSWLAKSGLRVPEDLGLAYLYRTEDEMKTWPGIDGNLQAVGAAAFDLVVEGLHTNRLGAPQDPKEVLIKGKWSNNTSVVEPNVKRSN